MTKRLFLATCLPVFCLTAAAYAQRVEFILDGSGSMWGEVGGEAKISVAKRVMTDRVRGIELPDNSTLGLTVYGHRAKGDCADIEHFPAVAYAERSQLVPLIEGIQPKGMTPIAHSLRIVGDSLKGQEESSSIVLVSDGIESCDKDPCDVARQLREESGIEVVIHVVGFDIQEGQEQLECIAEAGGGLFVTASKPEELDAALAQVEQVIVAPTPEPEPESINVAAAANGGHVVLFSSAYSHFLADRLIDEAQPYWLSSSAAPQSVVLGFADHRRARIAELLINPYNTQGEKRWAKEVEVFVSEESPYEGYRRAGAMTLEPVGTEQFLAFETPVEGRYVKLNFMSNQGDGSHIAAGEVMLMGHLLDADGHSGPPENLAATASGGGVEKATSEYSGFVAPNLIDGTEAYWLSTGASAQDVTLLLPGSDPQRVAAVAINPHNGQYLKRWAKDVEVFASTQSSYKGYVSLGSLELQPVGEYQVLRLPEPVGARYLRLRFLSNHGDGSHIAAGEVVVLGE